MPFCGWRSMRTPDCGAYWMAGAAAQVGLAEDIRQMPMGMQTVILEGGGALSASSARFNT